MQSAKAAVDRLVADKKIQAVDAKTEKTANKAAQATAREKYALANGHYYTSKSSKVRN